MSHRNILANMHYIKFQTDIFFPSFHYLSGDTHYYYISLEAWCMKFVSGAQHTAPHSLGHDQDQAGWEEGPWMIGRWALPPIGVGERLGMGPAMGRSGRQVDPTPNGARGGATGGWPASFTSPIRLVCWPHWASQRPMVLVAMAFWSLALYILVEFIFKNNIVGIL